MTRLASVIMGVAVVATMVLLSGCPQPATDYAKELEGTWTVSLMATVPNPAGTPPTTQVPSDVTVTITPGPDKNKGTINLTVVNSFPSPLVPVTTEGSGSFTVDATLIKATLEKISSTGPVPQAVQDLKGVEQDITWEIMGNKLTATSKPLFALLGVSETLVFTKK